MHKLLHLKSSYFVDVVLDHDIRIVTIYISTNLKYRQLHLFPLLSILSFYILLLLIIHIKWTIWGNLINVLFLMNSHKVIIQMSHYYSSHFPQEIIHFSEVHIFKMLWKIKKNKKTKKYVSINLLHNFFFKLKSIFYLNISIKIN